MYYELADELMNLIFSKKQVIYERKMSQLTKKQDADTHVSLQSQL